MEEFFVFMYPMVAATSLLAYMPQIRRLIAMRKSPDDISLSSWFLWTSSTALALGYGIFHIQDMMFCIMTSVTLVLMTVVVGLVLYKRYRYGTSRVMNPLELIEVPVAMMQEQPIPVRADDRR